MRGRGETHSEEHRGVQLDQRCQCRQEDSKVVARGERLQQEDERDHGERGVDGDGEEGEQRHADQVVEHAVDGLQCSEGGGVQRVALDALVGEADHGLHVVARVELGVSVAAHRNEGVGIQRAEQQELDVLVVRVGRAEAVAEEREQPARCGDAVGDVHGGEEAVKLEEEEVGEGDQTPERVGQQHAALQQRLQHHVHESVVAVLLMTLLVVLRTGVGLQVGHDVLACDEAVGGAREEQVDQRQQDEREGEDAGEEEDPEEQDHVVERVEDGPGSERREVRELGEKEEEDTLAGHGGGGEGNRLVGEDHVVAHEG